MEKLFVYGTLYDPEVQERVLGRRTGGTPDTLLGFRKDTWQGYPMVVPDENATIDGHILEVTADELAQIDIYESDAYIRERVTLRSGTKAWVYRNAI